MGRLHRRTMSIFQLTGLYASNGEVIIGGQFVSLKNINPQCTFFEQTGQTGSYFDNSILTLPYSFPENVTINPHIHALTIHDNLLIAGGRNVSSEQGSSDSKLYLYQVNFDNTNDNSTYNYGDPPYAYNNPSFQSLVVLSDADNGASRLYATGSQGFRNTSNPVQPLPIYRFNDSNHFDPCFPVAYFGDFETGANGLNIEVLPGWPPPDNVYREEHQQPPRFELHWNGTLQYEFAVNQSQWQQSFIKSGNYSLQLWQCGKLVDDYDHYIPEETDIPGTTTTETTGTDIMLTTVANYFSTQAPSGQDRLDARWARCISASRWSLSQALRCAGLPLWP